ncbi:hypothetical protein EC845_3554 [Comamonas sp. BIGb0124]|uniref:hypothetical protein n=1 Tax=Comamonas sp. BIGb0124 TaxID=2485130 RepID=UPI000FA21711|nr:hypothetical protein [Comamonas sp. BIGb0124]ROR18579.1 hypothetical protein EC845_3554 [Comamonas sp. BIGb0124]
MKRLFVAGQDPESREWIPVAQLTESAMGYELKYTRGALRLTGFSGLSRMQTLEYSYLSKSLFPFFRNRVISKSRPEYKNYISWLGLNETPTTPMELLAVTGGVRATDGYELIADPENINGQFSFSFFSRGAKSISHDALERASDNQGSADAYLMLDLQNIRDENAIAIRAESPYQTLLGYVPRYFCLGLRKLLLAKREVRCKIKKINLDAPLNMRVLIEVAVTCENGFSLFDGVEDFKTLASPTIEYASALQHDNIEQAAGH